VSQHPVLWLEQKRRIFDKSGVYVVGVTSDSPPELIKEWLKRGRFNGDDLRTDEHDRGTA